MSDEKMVRYTSEEVKRLPSETDWQRLQTMTDAEIEANAQNDLCDTAGPINQLWKRKKRRDDADVKPWHHKMVNPCSDVE